MTLFARNAPVLETDAPAANSVLCVGLGSGGSTVADLLPRESFFADSLLSKRVLTSGRGLCNGRSVDVRTHLTNCPPPPPDRC